MPELICERAGAVVEAFRIPLWGRVADETPPSWLIERMQSGEIFLNSLGGFSRQFQDGQVYSIPGDYLVYDKVDIEFCTASEFTHSYSLLDERQAA